ncbi:radical SAM protein [candidate division KSB1 bacterium]|nr:radical SAM protein [candidate division KSB1 bacterium]
MSTDSVTFPSYLDLHQSGQLNTRIDRLFEILESCTLCPHQCRVNRLAGERGTYCRAGVKAKISSFFPHFGEEEPLVGVHGSGTIFFAHCNLHCVFCQNYDISHLEEGREVEEADLARMMIYLQNQGCHNINFVTPTHFVPQWVAALPKAVELGLTLPIVYNCGGYESLEVIKLLDGIIDIYMPDTKFSSNNVAKKYTQAKNYADILWGVLKEMHRQVGNLRLDGQGITTRGLLIRHLVMPNDLSGTDKTVHFIAEQLSRDSYVNIMTQYRPCHQAQVYHEIARRITPEEYRKAVRIARDAGLWQGFGVNLVI